MPACASNIATDEILEESMDFYNRNRLLQPYSFYFRIGKLKILLQCMHSNVPLALNRNVRVVKRTRCGTGSHYLGSD
ncbi:hypothetical protein Syun_006228 [Stephania yunnanensis]|uniref:Uncharacterized protein n=1 Tax=Stephania yunnanensis TaxID=152371 RepID=A0AAP0KXV9_9MAGN